MPRIYIENKVDEKIKIYGPQYEERLGESVENFDMSVARYFTYSIASIASNKQLKLGFWRRYYASDEMIEWSIGWTFNDVRKKRLDFSISNIKFLIDERGDYCQLKLIMTTEGIEVIPLRKNYCFKKIHLPPKFG